MRSRALVDAQLELVESDVAASPVEVHLMRQLRLPDGASSVSGISSGDRAKLLLLDDVLVKWYSLEIVTSKFGALPPDYAAEATALETQREQLTAELRKTEAWPTARELIEAAETMAGAARRLIDTLDVSDETEQSAFEMRAALASILRRR